MWRICILLCICFHIGNAQSWDYSYTHYGKIDGLPSNKIYFLCKGIDGVLWVGTDAGLCKFDVNHFAREHFEGGGHTNAAGGRSSEALDVVTEKFKNLILSKAEELNY